MTKILVTGGSGFIGSYLVDELLKNKNYEIINLDIAKPPEEKQLPFWHSLSVLDRKGVIELFQKFQPNYVIHLAAYAETRPDNVMEDYKPNVEGSANLIAAIEGTASVEKVVFTSTQFVHQQHGLPRHDEDFAPHTIYGESKVMMEKMIRSANLKCCWTIIRPTNIWGPRHPRYSKEFWRVLKLGRYIHPGTQPVLRSYGYVGNVVNQIMQILQKDPSVVNRQIFYVGDEAINLYDWVNGFSLALTGKKVRTVPRILIRGLALAGDVLTAVKIKFPITSSRYRSMTEDNPAPMSKTFQTLGKPRFTLQQGIDETVKWLHGQDQFWRSK
jgi:GlcNAc-P-P-Und epimerase